MTGRVLIVDAVPTNRIVLRVKLAAAFYHVTQAESGKAALQAVLRDRPDVVIAAADLPDMPAGALCRQLRALPEGARLPILLLHPNPDHAARRACLAAGADEVLGRPLDDLLLLARLRALVRARDAESELELREDTRRALGLAEEAAEFSGPARVTLVDASRGGDLSELQATLQGLLPDRIEALSPQAALSEAAVDSDVFVVVEARSGEGAGLALLSQLRANPGSRHAALIYVARADQRRAAASALDIGASDILSCGLDPEELALRLRRQIVRKRTADRLRANMRHGLRAAVTDPLTGLYNRRYALPHLSRFADRAQRSGRPYALMLIDVDHFKAVNDTYGHAGGDAVLVAMAGRLRDALRSTDMLARIGGEEFLVAMPDMPRRRAATMADTLREAISASRIPLPAGQSVPVTVSIGVSIGVPGSGQPPHDLMEQADAALYAAKAAGRNTVMLADTVFPMSPPSSVAGPGATDAADAVRRIVGQ